MKIGIIYGTDREAATVQIVNWLKNALEQKGNEVVIGKPEEFQSFDCDGYIVGSSVYAFHLKGGFVKQLKKIIEHLQGKPSAAFVVCGFTKLSRFYIRGILRTLSPRPITKTVFKGFGDNKDENFDKQESKANEWANEVIDGFESSER